MDEAEAVFSRDITRDELVAELRALRPEFEREGVTHMSLVGSRARHDDRSDSDIDLAIEVESGRNFSLIDMIEIKHLVEDRLALNANILMARSLEPPLLEQVARDRLTLF